MTPQHRNAAARFMAKVSPEPNSGCWLWTGAIQTQGYGSFGFGARGRSVLAHRFSYELHVGPIPAGLSLDHFVCQTRSCVRFDHTEPVTTRINNIRGVGFSGLNARKTACLRGHPLSGDNLYIKPSSNKRQCRECTRASGRKGWHRSERRRETAALVCDLPLFEAAP